ncbi:MAG: hypothetical protein BJ554DRAFT_2404 [Olpidium bornovanus]|uniref:Transmembrane protein n=1 Tax=Olpidium bornovanus TaxID=278681 RepID=A0A8H8DM83_9FUNG|nr:MAG: hypothetical protein BJ554DRAFT_2404 [Olpidium bornovanus]
MVFPAVPPADDEIAELTSRMKSKPPAKPHWLFGAPKNRIVERQIWWQTNPQRLHTWQRGSNRYFFPILLVGTFVGTLHAIYGVYCLIVTERAPVITKRIRRPHPTELAGAGDNGKH